MGIVVEPKEVEKQGISTKERYIARKERMVSPELLNAGKYETVSSDTDQHNQLPIERGLLAANVLIVQNHKYGRVISVSKGREKVVEILDERLRAQKRSRSSYPVE